MPLIEIEALPQPSSVDPAAVTVQVNRAIAEAIGCKIEAVWTVWRTITGLYAQGEDVALEQPRATHGPVVHVFHHRSPAEVERIVGTIEQVLERELSLLPGNVFVTVQPVAFSEPGG